MTVTTTAPATTGANAVPAADPLAPAWEGMGVAFETLAAVLPEQFEILAGVPRVTGRATRPLLTGGLTELPVVLEPTGAFVTAPRHSATRETWLALVVEHEGESLRVEISPEEDGRWHVSMFGSSTGVEKLSNAFWNHQDELDAAFLRSLAQGHELALRADDVDADLERISKRLAGEPEETPEEFVDPDQLGIPGF